ncbi:rod shape-determining protein [Naasia sp. SYSU D00948]|uniref:rod shape-determining protein n=1 Tax=Naasia sp. SYSU D00948 TaxID=2817379 RepID=UPI001B302E56|nr:rod shape-determining protein [Naasia sp. SYSU D00948]
MATPVRPGLGGPGVPPSGEVGAIDLGSAWTVVYNPARGLLLDEPTVVAHARSGRVLATGRRALRPAVTRQGETCRPVRHGIVADPADCVHLLTDLLARAEVAPGTPVRLAVPIGATRYDLALLAGVVFSVTGAAPATVPSPLAAARGAGIDTRKPVLVCDVGAGLVELAVIQDDRLESAAAVPLGMRDYELTPESTLQQWVDAPELVLGTLPGTVRAALAGAPVHLVGGGSLAPGLAEQLSEMWGRPVERARGVRHPVAKGLLVGPRSRAA